MIPENLQTDFYSGKTNELIKFCINDPVEVISGDYKGYGCAVISIHRIEPEVKLLLEPGDGSFIIIDQKNIRLIEEN